MILVHCPCGKSIHVPPELAGKRIKCASCMARIEVPAASGTLSASPPLTKCPACQAALPPAAVLCVACGLDLRSGKKLSSTSGAPPAISTPIPGAPSHPDPAPQKSRAKKKRSGGSWLENPDTSRRIVLAGLLLPVLGLVGFFGFQFLGSHLDGAIRHDGKTTMEWLDEVREYSSKQHIIKLTWNPSDSFLVMPFDPRALPGLFEASTDPSDKIREVVRDKLGRSGAECVSQLPFLVAQLEDPQSKYQGLSLQVIGRMGVDGKEAIPAVSAVVMSKDSVEAVRTLTLLGPDAIPSLIEALTRPSPGVQIFAAEGLGGFGARVTGQGALEPLLQAMKSPEDQVRIAAVSALASVEPDGAGVVPAAIAMAFDDEDSDGRAAGQVATLSLGARSVPLLIERAQPALQFTPATSLEERDRVYPALSLLERIGPDASPAVGLLTAILERQETGMRDEAISTLIGIGPPAAYPAVPALLASLEQFGPQALTVESDESNRIVELLAGYEPTTEDLLIAFGASRLPVAAWGAGKAIALKPLPEELRPALQQLANRIARAVPIMIAQANRLAITRVTVFSSGSSQGRASEEATLENQARAAAMLAEAKRLEALVVSIEAALK